MYNRVVGQVIGNNSTTTNQAHTSLNSLNNNIIPFTYDLHYNPSAHNNSLPSTATPSNISSTPSPSSSIEAGNLISVHDTMYGPGHSGMPMGDGNSFNNFASFNNDRIPMVHVPPPPPIMPLYVPVPVTPVLYQIQQQQHQQQQFVLNKNFTYRGSDNRCKFKGLKDQKQALNTSKAQTKTIGNKNQQAANNSFGKYSQQTVQQTLQYPLANFNSSSSVAFNQPGTSSSFFGESSNTRRAPPGFESGPSTTAVSPVESWDSKAAIANIDEIFSTMNSGRGKKPNEESGDLADLSNGREQEEYKNFFKKIWSTTEANLFSSTDEAESDRFWTGINGAASALGTDKVSSSFSLTDSLVKSIGSLGIEEEKEALSKSSAIGWERQPQTQPQPNLKEYQEQFCEVISLFREGIRKNTKCDAVLCERLFEFFSSMFNRTDGSLTNLDRHSRYQLEAMRAELSVAEHKFSQDKTVLSKRIDEMDERFKNLLKVGTVGGPLEDVKMLKETLSLGWLQQTLRDVTLLNSMKHIDGFLELVQFNKKIIDQIPKELLGHLPLLDAICNQDSLDLAERIELDDAIKAHDTLVAELNKIRIRRQERMKHEIDDEPQGSESKQSSSLFSSTQQQAPPLGFTRENIIGLQREKQFDMVNHHLQLAPSMLDPLNALLVQANVPKNQATRNSYARLGLETNCSLVKGKSEFYIEEGDNGDAPRFSHSETKLLERLKPLFPQLTHEQLATSIKLTKSSLIKKNKQFSLSGFRVKQVVKYVEEYFMQNGEKLPAPVATFAKATQKPTGNGAAQSYSQVVNQRPDPALTPSNSGAACGWPSSISSTPTGLSNLSRSSTPGISKGSGHCPISNGGRPPATNINVGRTGGEDGHCDLCADLLPPISLAKGTAKMTRCKHRFHEVCLQGWYKNIGPNCPTCERPIVMKMEEFPCL